MATVRRTTAARPRAAVTKTIAELTASIAQLDAKLEELKGKQTAFLQNSFVSQKVYHKTFGEGVIIEQKEDIIKVSFPESGNVKSFVIHRKFVNRPVFEDDEEAISKFSEFADLRQSMIHLKQERIRLEKQRKELMLQ